jgi:ABC-2 type transport system ATP-binding protein
MDAIRTEQLTKTFNGLKAVDAVNIKAKKGEIFGILGLNGAGKTTFIKMLITLLKPTSGRAWVGGYDVVKERGEVRRCIGVVFQEPTLDIKLTAKENLDFHARMYGYDGKTRIELVTEGLKMVDLEDKANVLVEKFSGGMQRRLEIARGLMHRPEVLFLDEPTLGLDVQTRRNIWEKIKEMNEEDVTFIVSTHYMEEAEYLCHRVATMDMGKIISIGDPEELKEKFREATLEDVFLKLTGREIRDEEGSRSDFVRKAHVMWHRRRR